MSVFILSLLFPSLLLASALPPLIDVIPSTSPSLKTSPAVCFPPQPYVYPIFPPDCTGAFVVLGSTYQYDKIRDWTVPYDRRWISQTGKCQIVLHPLRFGAEDFFSPLAIAEKAGQVLRRCVAEGYHLGGAMSVGNREVFAVVITNPDNGPPQAIHRDA